MILRNIYTRISLILVFWLFLSFIDGHHIYYSLTVMVFYLVGNSFKFHTSKLRRNLK